MVKSYRFEIDGNSSFEIENHHLEISTIKSSFKIELERASRIIRHKNRIAHDLARFVTSNLDLLRKVSRLFMLAHLFELP